MSPTWCPYPQGDQSSESLKGLLPIARANGVTEDLRIRLRQRVMEVLLSIAMLEECSAKSPRGRIKRYIHKHTEVKVSSQIKVSHHRALRTV